MNDELNKLIYENKNLIYYFVNKYKNYYNYDDLYNRLYEQYHNSISYEI